MRKLTFLALTLISLLPFTLRAVGVFPDVNRLRAGKYVNLEFLQKLKKTRSPLASLNGIYEISGSVTPLKDDRRFIGFGNLHEGTATLEFDGKGRLIDPRKMSINVVSPTQFSLTLGDGSATSFVFYEASLNQLVCSIVLAGTYEDQNGKTFTFSDECAASFPAYQFRLHPVLDISELTSEGERSGVDRFVRNDTKESIAYEFSGNVLKLYRMTKTSDGNLIKEEDPWLVLYRRVK